MKSIMQQLSESDVINAQFRQILSGRNPTVEMKSEHEDSRLILEQIATTICATDSQRSMLQTVYDLGRLDGGIDQNRKASELLKDEIV